MGTSGIKEESGLATDSEEMQMKFICSYKSWWGAKGQVGIRLWEGGSIWVKIMWSGKPFLKNQHWNSLRAEEKPAS